MKNWIPILLVVALLAGDAWFFLHQPKDDAGRVKGSGRIAATKIAGLLGVAWAKRDPKAEWPARLAVKLPE